MANVNLSASAYWVPSMASMSYLNYGAAVSEVCFSIHTFTVNWYFSSLTCLVELPSTITFGLFSDYFC